jgi:hypothetical protein
MSEETQGPADVDNVLKECHDFWFTLIQKAMDRSSFDTLCTLLRPRGMHDAGWDVLDESEATFEDFNWMLKTAHEARGKATARRLALHYYCFVIEMNPIHEMIMNLLRCISGQHYLPLPFWHLTRRKSKTDQWNIVLPSMGRKLREIVQLATAAGESDLVSRIEYVFDDRLRNAVAHSDYVLTEKELRSFESRRFVVMPLDEVDRKINYTFRFVSGLLKGADNMKYALSRGKRYHKWDNYEVLELLSDDNGVYGFNIHFSNGNKSTFERTKDGVKLINMRLSDGVGFMVGMIDKLEPVWKVDGVPVANWDELNRRPGESRADNSRP